MSPCLVDPLGFRQDGRPIWAFAGSAPDDGGEGGGTGDNGGGNDDGDPGGGSDDDENAIGDDGLNAKGRNAIKAERTKVRNLTQEVRDWRLLARDLGEGGSPATPARIRELLAAGGKNGDPGGSGGSQVDVERIRQEAEREAMAKAQRRVALAEVRALAATKFADPADAVAFLQGDVDDLLDRQGEPDVDAIEHALSDLLERKPHLKKIEEGTPSYDGGPRTTGASDQSMNDWIRSTKQRERR